MIKGEHCAMCNANIICEEIKPEDKYCKEVRAKYNGKAAANDVKGLFDYVKNRLKNIEELYGVPYIILLTTFKSLIEDESINEILGDETDAKNHD